MNALAIDCALSKLTVAAMRDDRTVKLTYDIGIRQSEKLLPAMDMVLKETDMSAGDLDFTALTLGPGTFTGLRLGLSALKAISLSHSVPVYGIPSLTAYAKPYLGAKGALLSVMESKDDEFFFEVYNDGELMSQTCALQYGRIIERIRDTFPGITDFYVCGPAAEPFSKKTEAEGVRAHPFAFTGDAAESLLLLAEEMRVRNVKPLEDYDGPLYMRKSEAELTFERKG